MRLLKRQSAEDQGAAASDGTAEPAAGPKTSPTADTAESERVVERRRPLRRTSAPDRGGGDAEPGPDEPRRGPRQWFRRTVTVPLTVPQRSLHRTMTVPSRRLVGGPTTPTWTLAGLASTAAGGVLAVVGLVALIRAGVNETWFRPEIEVLNANHTPLLGLIELGAGALLVLLGLAGNRILVAMAGIAGALVATAAAVEPEELQRELAIEDWWAWILAGAGVALTLLALQAPRPRQETVIDVRE